DANAERQSRSSGGELPHGRVSRRTWPHRRREAVLRGSAAAASGKLELLSAGARYGRSGQSACCGRPGILEPRACARRKTVLPDGRGHLNRELLIVGYGSLLSGYGLLALRREGKSRLVASEAFP